MDGTLPDHIPLNDQEKFNSARRILSEHALKHHVYNRFVNLVREKKIPFGYISTSNIDKGLKQMAEEL